MTPPCAAACDTKKELKRATDAKLNMTILTKKKKKKELLFVIS